MSRIIIGPYNTPAGPRRWFGEFDIYAQDGMVVTEERDTGEVIPITVPVARSRLQMLIGELEVTDRQRISVNQTEKKFGITRYPLIRQLCQNLEETIREARLQGDPTDDAVRQLKLISFLRGRRDHSNPNIPSPNTVFKLQAEEDARLTQFPELPKPHTAIAVKPPDVPDGYKNRN